MNRQHDAGFHVEHTRAGGFAVVDRERSSGQRTEREHGVVVSDQQHARRVAEPSVHMWAGRAVDQFGVTSEPALDHIANSAR